MEAIIGLAVFIGVVCAAAYLWNPDKFKSVVEKAKERLDDFRR